MRIFDPFLEQNNPIWKDAKKEKEMSLPFGKGLEGNENLEI